MRWLLPLVILAVGCGASPVAPTVSPVGLDPEYVHTIARWRWTGGAFHHCFAPTLAPYTARMEYVADRVSALSGIPRTENGPCNVEWVTGIVPGEVRPAFSTLFGNDTTIGKVVVTIQDVKMIEDRPAAVLHEGGHVLGLWHSTVPTDLMNPNVAGDQDFSPNELAVLAWMYGR